VLNRAAHLLAQILPSEFVNVLAKAREEQTGEQPNREE
jgi:hypothetical protein